MYISISASILVYLFYDLVSQTKTSINHKLAQIYKKKKTKIKQEVPVRKYKPPSLVSARFQEWEKTSEQGLVKEKGGQRYHS